MNKNEEDVPSVKAISWVNTLATWDLEHEAMPSTKCIMRDINPPFGHDDIAAHIQHVKKTTSDIHFLRINPSDINIMNSKFFHMVLDRLRCDGC